MDAAAVAGLVLVLVGRWLLTASSLSSKLISSSSAAVAARPRVPPALADRAARTPGALAALMAATRAIRAEEDDMMRRWTRDECNGCGDAEERSLGVGVSNHRRATAR